MAYPLDIEQVLDAVRAKVPVCESVEDVYRIAVPLVNDSFEDGRGGRPFMLQNAEAEITAYQEATGKETSPAFKEIVGALVAWCREAYEQGQHFL